MITGMTISRSSFDDSRKRFKDFCQLSKIDPQIVKDCLIIVLVIMTCSPRLLPLTAKQEIWAQSVVDFYHPLAAR